MNKIKGRKFWGIVKEDWSSPVIFSDRNSAINALKVDNYLVELEVIATFSAGEPVPVDK